MMAREMIAEPIEQQGYQVRILIKPSLKPSLPVFSGI